jgi:hypothetical protein
MSYAGMKKKVILTTLLGVGIFAGCFFLVWRIGENFIRLVPATRKTVLWCTFGVSTVLTASALIELRRLRK